MTDFEINEDFLLLGRLKSSINIEPSQKSRSVLTGSIPFYICRAARFFEYKGRWGRIEK